MHRKSELILRVQVEAKNWEGGANSHGSREGAVFWKLDAFSRY